MYRISEDEEEEDDEEGEKDSNPTWVPPTFERVGLAAMMQANPSGICSAKGEDVRKVSVEYLLQERLRIPLFQRRYCWGEDQWKLLYKDISDLAVGTKLVHSLGRLTCAIGDLDDGRILVVDGQQRNTTCTILLAALRDVAAGRPEDGTCISLVSKLNAALFPDANGLESWIARKQSSNPGSITVEEGESLCCAALVPTYSDRASYFAAILPPGVAAATEGVWRRPTEAKSFFVDQVRERSSEQLFALADAVLHKLEWLYFPVDTSRGNADGTENLQVIFERLAVREALIIKPMMQNRAEAADMGAVDFVRNLLLSSFHDESKAVHMYKCYWLVIENSMECTSLEHMIDSFLREQPELVAPLPAELLHVPVGGQLYPRFRRWLAAALSQGVNGEGSACSALDDKAAVEEKTAAVMQRLATFASDFAANQAQSSGLRCDLPQKFTSATGQSQCASRDMWRCPRCALKNSNGIVECLACRQPKPSVNQHMATSLSSLSE